MSAFKRGVVGVSAFKILEVYFNFVLYNNLIIINNNNVVITITTIDKWLNKWTNNKLNNKRVNKKSHLTVGLTQSTCLNIKNSAKLEHWQQKNQKMYKDWLLIDWTKIDC